MTTGHTDRCSAEVVIVGAGPAGTTLASHLAAQGHDVLLLDSRTFPRWVVGESLTPKILSVLERTGIRRQVEDAGFNRMTGHSHLWETPDRIETEFEDGTGFQVDRAIFDSLLKDNATRNGATFCSGITAIRTTSEGNVVTGVEWQDDQGARGVTRAQLVVDATGGAGVLARQHGLRYDLDWPTTIAMVGYLRGPDELGTRTLVEAFDNGWVWSFQLADGRRGISLFIDPDQAKQTPPSQRTVEWLGMLSGASTLREYLSGATVVTEPISCGVKWYSCKTRGIPGLLVIGDAADFVDPLSSQGVYRAMDGAHRAAIAAEHILRDAARWESVIRWYDGMESRAAAAYTEQMRQSYDIVAKWQKSPFFARRQGLSPRIDGVPFPSEIASARERLKDMGRRGEIPSAVFRCQGSLNVDQGMTLIDGRLIPEPHVVCSLSALSVKVPDVLQDLDWLPVLEQEGQVRELIAKLELRDARSRETLMEFLVEMTEAGHLKAERTS